MSLIEIGTGAEARAQVLNDNFNYLEELISSSASSLETKINSTTGNISNITSNMATIQTNLTNATNTANSKASKDLSDTNPSDTFKANAIDWMAPNYGAGYEVASGWTAPCAGWIACYGTSGEGSHTAWYVDGAEVFRDDQSWGGGRAGGQGSRSMAFIEKGSVVTRSGNNNNAMFYPCKGVQ